MIIRGKQKQILFIDICKTAGTALGEAFRSKGYSVQGKHHGVGSRCRLPVNDISNFDIIFTVIRNPYDRIASLYRWYRDKRPFKQWLQHVPKGIKGHVYRTIPQVDWITRNGNFVTTDILRFENLQEDFDNMMQKYGLESFNIPKHNVSQNYQRVEEYYASDDEFYDEEVLNLVETYYHEDFEKFGYEKL